MFTAQSHTGTRRWIYLFAPILCALVILALSTGEASAATKKPAKVSLTGVSSADYNTIKITWKKANAAEKYQVYRASSKNGKYKKVATTASRTYINRKLKFGKKYYYKVRALNKSKKGAFSQKKAATPKLKKVSGTTASSAKTGSVTLSWKKVNGATGYQVYRATSKKGSFKKVKSPASARYTQSGLSKGKTYYYKIRAYRKVKKSNKYGAFSNVISYRPGFDIKTIRTDMLREINKERKKAGAKPLSLFEPVNKTAQEKAIDMYKIGELNHYSKNLGFFDNQFDKAGIDYLGGGENIAWGQPDVPSVMNSWMHSPGHKKNILEKSWTHVGIGYYKGYWVQQFIESPKDGDAEDGDSGDNIEIPADGTPVTCTKCGAKNPVYRYDLYSTDDQGVTYGCFYCSNCMALLEKCPKCKTGLFEPSGFTKENLVAQSCNKCGYECSKAEYVDCPYCGVNLTENNDTTDYAVTFDSTGTYDGKDYQRIDGCYFQQVIFSGRICTHCHKYVIFNDDNQAEYKEFYDLLKRNLGSDKNIFEHIYWEIPVGQTDDLEGENGSSYKIVYAFTKTPPVKGLDELLGTEQLTPNE